MVELANTEGTSKTRLFISYSRKDSAFVDALTAALSANGYQVRLDREDISGGEAWKERIEHLILSSDAVAFVVSPDSISSRICDWEIKLTVALGKRLIPLLLRPIAGDPPEELARLNYIFLDVEEKFDDGLRRLCAACDVDIAWVREHTRLTQRASEWISGGRRSERLLRGEDLTAAEVWLAKRQRLAPEVPNALMSYLQACRAEETTVLQKQIEQANRLTEIETARAQGEKQRREEAISRQLAAQSELLGARQLDLAILLAVEAYKVRDTREARNALLALVSGHHCLVSFLTPNNQNAGTFVKKLRRRGLVFEPRGSLLAHICDHDRIKVWSLTSKLSLVATLPTGSEAITALAFSPDGSRLAATDEGSALWLWDTSNWRLSNGPKDLSDQFEATASKAYVGVSFHPNGQECAISRGTKIVVVATLSGEVKRGISVKCLRQITDLHWSATARRFIVQGFPLEGNSQRTAIVDYPVGPWSHERIIGGTFDWEAPNGSVVVRGATEARIELIDPSEKSAVELCKVPEALRTWSVARNVKAIALADSSLKLVRWTDARDHEVLVLNGHLMAPQSMTFSPDGALLASHGFDDAVVLWRTTQHCRLAQTVGPMTTERHGGWSSCQMSFDADGRYLANLSEDGRLSVLDLQRNEVIPLVSQPFKQIAASKNGWMGLGADNKLYRVVPTPTHTVIERASIALDVRAFSLGRLQQRGFIVDALGVLFAVDLETSEVRRVGSVDLSELPEGSRSKSSGIVRGVLAASPGCDLAALITKDGRIRMYRWNGDGNFDAPIATDLEQATIAFTHCGKRLLVTAPESFQIWDIERGEPIRRFATGSSTGAPLIADISEDGAFLAWKTHMDMEIRIFDGDGSVEVCRLPLLSVGGFAGALAFSHDGHRLAIASGVGGATIWTFDPVEWSASGRAIANRSLSHEERRRFGLELADHDHPVSAPGIALDVSPSIPTNERSTYTQMIVGQHLVVSKDARQLIESMRKKK